MLVLIFATTFTIAVSFLCSLLEAMFLSTTTADIEALKKTHPKKGEMMEYFKSDIEETSSAILALNTIANTLGSVIVGGLATEILGEHSLLYFSLGMTAGILIFSEILPKNVGLLYRSSLLKSLVYSLYIVRCIMMPISKASKRIIRFLLPAYQIQQHGYETEILLLAEKGEKEGTLTKAERDIIASALTLEHILVKDIMTPNTVITALDKSLTINEVLKKFGQVPFARIPVFDGDADNVVGLIRRRDLIKADREKTVGDIMLSITFIPENVSAADALKHFLQNQQQLVVAIDEYGSVSGVIALEDVFEHIIGKEIFDKDDIAVDMRVHAREQTKKLAKPKKII